MLRRIRHFFAVAVPTGLILLLAAVLLCYVNRWDQTVPITLVPMWAWAGFAMLVSAIAWPLLKSPLSLVTFALWLVAGVALSDETAGLIRVFRSGLAGDSPPPISAEKGPDRLRVITVNAAGAEVPESLDSLSRLGPDIVFLQEVMDRAQLIDLTSELFGPKGSFIRSETCAILTQGTLSDVHIDEATGSILATLERPQGEVINLANLHLPTAIPRFDLWERECWIDLTARRRENRKTIRQVLGVLSDRGRNHPNLIAGSFATPPSDDIFRLLRNAGMKDSFRQAGFGWGNTYPLTFRLMRSDQIWGTLPYLPERSESFRSGAPEHLGVVTDFRRASLEGNLADPPSTSPRIRIASLD